MKETKIKPIPKYLLEKIRKRDQQHYYAGTGFVRYYAYLTKNDGELVKVTVAAKNKRKDWYCKQVAIHGIHSQKCFIKDFVFYMMGSYSVGWYAEGIQKNPKWFESDEWGWTDDRYCDPYAPVVNPEYLSRFPEYKYSAVELYNGVEYFKYLRQYERFPQVEYLMKAGLPSLIYSKQILEKVTKDKRFCKWLITNKDIIEKTYHYVFVILRAYSTGKPIQQLQKVEEWKNRLIHESSMKTVREFFKGKLESLYDYLEKQNIEPSIYQDYLRACQYLGLDMTEDKNRFPHDFHRWHDIRIDEYKTAKAMKDAEERKEMYAQFASIAEKYVGLQENRDGFAIVIPHSPADLIREGDTLHHCVGRMGYDHKMIREETLILFVRAADNPETPFVTMEYSLKSKKILQCYADHNAQPDESVLNFVRKKWLPYANRKVRAMQKSA